MFWPSSKQRRASKVKTQCIIEATFQIAVNCFCLFPSNPNLLNNAKDIDTSFVLNYGKMATKLKKKLALKWPQKCCKGAYALKPILIDCPNIFFNMLSRRGDISRRIRPQKPKCLANPSDLLSNFSILMKTLKKGQLQGQNSFINKSWRSLF